MKSTYYTYTKITHKIKKKKLQAQFMSKKRSRKKSIALHIIPCLLLSSEHICLF